MMGRKKRRPRARFLQSQANFVGLRLAAANLRLLSVLIFYDYCYDYFYDFYDFYELSIGRETRWRGQTEGRSGERADHDNRRRPNSLGKQNRSVCRWCRCCCCFCYSRAATGAAASANDDEMLPPSYDNNGKNNDTKGGEHTTRRRQRRRRRRRRRQRRRCRRATCGIHGLHYTRVRFVLCDVDFFTTSIKLNP